MSELIEKVEEKKPKRPKKDRSKAAAPARKTFVSIVNGDFFSRDNLIKNLPFFAYITFLLVLYIGYGYYVEKTSANIADLQEQSLELKADENNENAYYNQVSMYSHIEDSSAVIGVGPSLVPPVKIQVSKSIFNTDQ